MSLEELEENEAFDLEADFQNHYIEGFARAEQEKLGKTNRDGYFKCPLISEVMPNLWQGGCRDLVHLPKDFRFVFSLYPWEQYTLGADTIRHEVKLLDAAVIPDEAQLHQIAADINVCRVIGKTLVHCQAGLNRSGLLTGLALIKGGMNPAEAIKLLRDSRSPMVLCNETFEKWLLALEEGKS